MREIKFRAWDKENHCFFQPTFESYKGKVEDLIISFDGSLMMRTFEHPAIHESCFKDRFILCQYTGSKDKNGKDIYESDIVKNKYDRMCKVIWNEYQGRLDLTAINSDGHVRRYFWWNDWEIIGNIYENPELIANE